MATENKTVSSRITTEQEEFLTAKFGNPSKGLAACATEMQTIFNKTGLDNSYPILVQLNILAEIRAYTKRELKGTFTSNEWKFMVDTLNGTIVTDQFRCTNRALAAEMEDSAHFQKFDEKWNVDLHDFLYKIFHLSGAQVDCIYHEIEKYWNETPDLDKWVSEIC